MFANGVDFKTIAATLLLSLPAVLWSVSFHEYCHGLASYKLGDPTAKLDGRMSLNPFHHFDAVGALCLVMFRFGWARPVPINPSYFKNPKRDFAIVSLAGPLGNIFTAFVLVQLIRFFPRMLNSYAIGSLILITIHMNVGMAAFNLLPIPPLDGSRILFVLLPRELMRFYDNLERWGIPIILLLMMTNILPKMMRPITAIIIKILQIGF